MKVAAATQSEAKAGTAVLEVNIVSGESAVTTSFARSPFKVLTPRARGQSVWAYTSSFGGGFVAGDETSLNIRVGTNARCFISTQASTKIYRNPESLPCGHRTHANLEPDALLVFAPDPVQAFADSHYAQRQRFDLGAGAGLVLVDWFTSGRVARGERWAFKKFHSRNEVFIDDQLAFLDSLYLSSQDGDLAGAHRMGRFNCVALLLLIGSRLRDEAEVLLKEISTRAVEKHAPLVCSASPVREGVVVRIAAEHAETVGHELRRQMAFVPRLLGDDPWTRRTQ